MANEGDFDRRVLRLFDGYVHGLISRRQFLDGTARITASATSAAAILASLAPNYALAEQVNPDDESITTSYKKYASPAGGVMRGYFARPAVFQHKLPAVLVVHENRGLNPYIEDVTRRLAVAGFIAFAPDALTPVGGYPGNDDDGRTLQASRDRGEMFEDFVAAVDYLQVHPDASGSVGTVGFCYGGSVSMQLAIRNPKIKATVAYYGSHPDAGEAEKIKPALMLHHGALDDRVNAGWPRFETALKAADIEYEEFQYADAGHGFHNDTTPRFVEDAAALSWRRTVSFFAKHLGLQAE